MSYSFAERIKKFMEIKELTQVPLAQKAGRKTEYGPTAHGQ
jgi:hypothetical protein